MNGTDIVILCILAVIVGLVIWSMVRDKKKGNKSGCGCGCSSCSSSGACLYNNKGKKSDKK